MTQGKYYHIDNNTGLIRDDVEEKELRSCTDRSYLFVFLMFFALWSGIAIYASSTGEPIDDYFFGIDFCSSSLFVGRFIILGFVWFAILSLGLFFVIINWIPKCTIYFTNFVTLALLFAAFVADLTLFSAPVPLAPFFFAAFFIFSIVLYVLHQVGTDVICKIIRDSSRAMRAFPSSIVIVISQLVIIVFIIFCCTTISIYLTQPERFRYQTFAPLILLLINVIYSIWMIFFVLNVGRALLHGNFIIWYQAEDKSAMPKNTLSRQFNNTLKYHLGTLAFGSTIFTKFQILRSVCSNEIRLENIYASLPKCVCFFIVLEHSSVNALIFSVIHGKHSYESTKHTINFLMQNYKKFVAVRVITRLILGLGFIIIPTIPIGLTGLYFASSDSNCFSKDLITATIVAVSCISITITALTLYVFDSAIEAVLLSHLHELNENELNEKIAGKDENAYKNPLAYCKHV